MRDPAGGLANSVYLRLMTPLGGYWADPTLGSKLHLLQRQKDVSRVAKLARQYAEQALAPIVEDGRATSIVITTEQPGTGRMHLLIEATAASGERLTFRHPVKVL
ncbi:MAG: phage GP46 family protein [Candidatus Accumulibacter sp.]|uniref:phage GP46 family protein n=1 Tax=Accumulibacter sp. TaxID=2053492 RepID=UPI0025FB2D6E|nr:phage GP46 family protein [Accumulibacter sp.]MCM8595126.1 phage GP46 family protein [Accumulibacter sp.]MCM8625512.1 phage GP46 family protein [Accumulibacter sp.]MDS4049272.1 phage GP46 family protein [Accumulibacter sp.]